MSRLNRVDMLSEMTSHEIATLADLAVSNYTEFEMQLQSSISDGLAITHRFDDDVEVAEAYRIMTGAAPQGWENDLVP